MKGRMMGLTLEEAQTAMENGHIVWDNAGDPWLYIDGQTYVRYAYEWGPARHRMLPECFAPYALEEPNDTN
jgi:hypothetical protein